MAAIFDQFTFDSNVFNGGFLPNGASPSASTQGQILLAIVGQLIAKGVWASGSVGLSLTRQPSSHPIGQTYGTVTPGRIDVIRSMSSGAGRYVFGVSQTVYVNVYLALALDESYQDTQWLTNQAGVRAKVFQVADALQMLLPVASNGLPLTIEPIRLLGNEKAWKYERSPEWGMCGIPINVRYRIPLTTSMPPTN